MSETHADYIVVGGGLTGCAIAARLQQSPAKPKVVLLEAGLDASDNPNLKTPLGGLSLLGSELDYVYTSEAQPLTYDRTHTLNAGKVLGGGSSVNFGGWLRGNVGDYDLWASTVGDNRWSHEGLLPWMRQSEKYFDAQADPKLRGFNGIFDVTSVSGSHPNRRYPLRDPVRAAWEEIGYPLQPHTKKTGDIAGLNEFHENSRNGNRQTSYSAYGLDDIELHTNAIVQRVTFTDGAATGVELTDGRQFTAKKEIILCAGAYRTPQILMLSGIGPSGVLKEQNIPLVHENPQVGQNLSDHFVLYIAFRLKDHERGLALGSPKVTDPAFFTGMPIDWVVNIPHSPESITQHVFSEKEFDRSEYAGRLTQDERTLVETFVMYVAGGIPGIPSDGSHVVTSTMLLLPTSRGNVSLASNKATDYPRINPNYFATALDRAVLVDGVRQTLKALLGTEALKDYFEAEVPGSGPGLPELKPLTQNSTDEEIETRIRMTGAQHHHSGGTAAMGTVADTEGRVFGVKGLRVADASLIPVPLGGHPQASLYAMAEQLASMIINNSN